MIIQHHCRGGREDAGQQISCLKVLVDVTSWCHRVERKQYRAVSQKVSAANVPVGRGGVMRIIPKSEIQAQFLLSRVNYVAKFWLLERKRKGGFAKGWFGECTSFRFLVPGEHSNVPSFRFLVPGNIRMYPGSGFWYQGNIRQNHPFGNHPFVKAGSLQCGFWPGNSQIPIWILPWMFWWIFCSYFFPRKKARKNPPKNAPQNSPGTLFGEKFPSDFSAEAFSWPFANPRQRGQVAGVDIRRSVML